MKIPHRRHAVALNSTKKNLAQK